MIISWSCWVQPGFSLGCGRCCWGWCCICCCITLPISCAEEESWDLSLKFLWTCQCNSPYSWGWLRSPVSKFVRRSFQQYPQCLVLYDYRIVFYNFCWVWGRWTFLQTWRVSEECLYSKDRPIFWWDWSIHCNWVFLCLWLGCIVCWKGLAPVMACTDLSFPSSSCT